MEFALYKLIITITMVGGWMNEGIDRWTYVHRPVLSFSVSHNCLNMINRDICRCLLVLTEALSAGRL